MEPSLAWHGLPRSSITKLLDGHLVGPMVPYHTLHRVLDRQKVRIASSIVHPLCAIRPPVHGEEVVAAVAIGLALVERRAKPPLDVGRATRRLVEDLPAIIARHLHSCNELPSGDLNSADGVPSRLVKSVSGVTSDGVGSINQLREIHATYGPVGIRHVLSIIEFHECGTRSASNVD